MKMRARIMIVEDEVLVAIDLKRQLSRRGYDVVRLSGSGEDAVQQAATLKPDVILMDIRLPGNMDGFEAARLIRGQQKVPIVFVTGYADAVVRNSAQQFPHSDLLDKPTSADSLDTAIGALIQSTSV